MSGERPLGMGPRLRRARVAGRGLRLLNEAGVARAGTGA